MLKLSHFLHFCAPYNLKSKILGRCGTKKLRCGAQKFALRARNKFLIINYHDVNLNEKNHNNYLGQLTTFDVGENFLRARNQSSHCQRRPVVFLTARL